MREDPIISAAWIKAALVLLVAGALGVGAYILASGVDVNLPDLDLNTTTEQTTNLSDTTLEDTTIDSPPATTGTIRKPATPPGSSPPSIQELQRLNRCIEAAGSDIDEVTACFDRYTR
jgi:hypothetical protein